jgi:hypothetical protein
VSSPSHEGREAIRGNPKCLSERGWQSEEAIVLKMARTT